jgi:phosphoenolpyruvate phosphomutase
MEAHNGVSARIAEEAGFAGIWASGLTLSAQFGVRDNNEASWTQIVEMLEFMSDVTEVPILLDGDTGYGNFNNLRRLVRKLEQRGIAGVCIEDKLFPKTNSFIAGERQQLADIEEFCGKIKAGKDSQQDPEFCIVARVEALIAGHGMAEALKRGEAYRQAGADAILIHSKLSRPDEIVAFAAEWAARAPLVIVPTKYYSTPLEVYRAAGVSLVIWANHMLRAAVAAMQATAERIYHSGTPVEVEDHIAAVEEVFRLQGAAELAAAERRYAGAQRADTSAVVLAASRGLALAALTEARPKGMLPVGGKPLLRRLADELKKQGVNDITVVAGYRAESVDLAGITLVVNEAHEVSGELWSLACAEYRFTDDMVILYGDLLFRGYILRELLESRAELTVVVDSAPSPGPPSDGPDYAYCSRPDDRALLDTEVRLLRIASEPAGTSPSGRFIGMLRVQGAGREWLAAALATLRGRPGSSGLSIPDLLNYLVAEGRPVRVLYIHGHWLDVNSLADLERAGDFARGG